MPNAAKRFRVGDRVRFVGSHPWVGYSGVIIAPFFNSVGLDWEVQIENGVRSAAAEKNMEPANA